MKVMRRGRTNLRWVRAHMKFPKKFQPNVCSCPFTNPKVQHKEIGCRSHSTRYKDMITRHFTNFKRNISRLSQKSKFRSDSVKLH
ncbi:hypothetical protein EUGRSUZ_B03090 [Eucalyptus grandis]|uniref:Uncharacterized protein n=2 Tax=Eucalyptus grandis TaxID=71139 RepID=A0ACC3LVZ5_EUCGR|nr:hypothetical protein EUGRSUZ_B03090 [Eucalyptus grandis]